MWRRSPQEVLRVIAHAAVPANKKKKKKKQEIDISRERERESARVREGECKRTQKNTHKKKSFARKQTPKTLYNNKKRVPASEPVSVHFYLVIKSESESESHGQSIPQS